ncbi:hypothetical protein Lal_00023363 [Lupinus albus]|nr:hypothetical protein Lal_00023363 [Lupinus albus]
MGSIPEFLIPTFMEVEAISHYLEIESSFMPEPTFYTNPANLKIRKLAVSIIAKHWTSQNTDAFVPYLAMNYFDRFASRNPDSDAKVPLVAICCLTLASKMRTKSFSLDMIPRGMYDFKHKTIRRMELRILDGLEWQMRPVTPFCFLDHLYPTFLNIGGFKRRCINQIIVQAQGEDYFIGYKPSDFAFSCFVAATIIWNRSKLASIELPDANSRLHYDLAAFCRKKNIRIECAEWKKASSSKAAAAKPQRKSYSSTSSAAVITLQGPSEGSSSSAAVITLQGPSEGSSSSAAVITLQGPSEGSSSSAGATTEEESDQQRPEGAETSEETAAADIGTESGQQRPEVAETSEEFAEADTGTVSGQQTLEALPGPPEDVPSQTKDVPADIGTESGQQRPEVADTYEEFAEADTGTVSGQQTLEALPGSSEDAPFETESEKQRRLERGKAAVVETDDEDKEDPLEQFFQSMLKRVRTSIQGIVPAAEAAAPRRLMAFDLTWPTDDPFADESRTPTIRHPTTQPLNVELQQMNEGIGCCEYLTCGCCCNN